MRVVEDTIKRLRSLQPFEMASLKPPETGSEAFLFGCSFPTTCHLSVIDFGDKNVIDSFHQFTCLDVIVLYCKRLRLFFLDYGPLWDVTSNGSIKAHSVIAIPFVLYTFGLSGLLQLLEVDRKKTAELIGAVTTIWKVYSVAYEKFDQKTIGEQEIENVDHIVFEPSSSQFEAVFYIIWELIQLKSSGGDAFPTHCAYLEHICISQTISMYLGHAFVLGNEEPPIKERRRHWTFKRFMKAIRCQFKISMLDDFDILGRSIAYFKECKISRKELIWSLQTYLVSLLIVRGAATISSTGQFVAKSTVIK